MAVYTDVAAEDLAEFLKGYDIGELLSYKGIAEGVENSNFLLHTSKGAFILTLYEKRVAVDDLPYFLSLMAHLAERGVRCPQPARNRKGEVYSELAGRPAAIINFLEGVWPRRPTAAPLRPSSSCALSLSSVMSPSLFTATTPSRMLCSSASR